MLNTNMKKNRILFVYSDEKLYTEKTLKKIEHDLSQEFEIESFHINALHNLRFKTPENVFFFYFLSTGREQAKYVNELTQRILNGKDHLLLS